MTADFRVPAAEIRTRIDRIQAILCQQEVDALFIAQRVDLFYFSGTAQDGCLYIPAEGEPTLFIRRYPPRAREESSLERIVEIRSTRELPGRIADTYGARSRRIGFELDALTVRTFRRFRTLLDPSEAVDGSAWILDIRAVKSAWEIRQMEAAAALSARTFDHMESLLETGLTEMAFAARVEAYARENGHAGMLRARGDSGSIYTWQVVSGESGGVGGCLDASISGEGTSAAFPSGAGYRRLSPGEPILVDFGTVRNGYHMDETRMFSIGPMAPEAERACTAAIEIHDRLIEAVRPGVTAGSLFDLAVAHARELGFEEAFLGLPGYKCSFVGHGIGAELVEPPFIARGRKERLVPGMTLALEPKMIFAGRFGAGIESVVQVTDTGHRMLTRIPARIMTCESG